MARWFSEPWTDDIKFSVKINKRIFSKKSKYQKIAFYDSDELGRFFTLDGYMMANERDEFIYHEMMIHVPMSVNPEIKSVLVIGGGDGGSVRELTRYASIQSIDMVEIDEEVVRTCERYLPLTASKLRDPRVKLLFENGALYVRETGRKYDLIVVDSTDPYGAGTELFTADFYQNCFKLLSSGGILVNQHESPYFDEMKTIMQKTHAKLKKIFPIALVYQAFIPTYASGHWLFGFASKKLHPIDNFKPDIQKSLNIKTKYYNKKIHIASFALPNYVKQALIIDNPFFNNIK
ncbi:MAG: polyamine aminopropyltransferase [Bacilli bacterium]|nr:polyamine aminopropyltransferase [Bacilli bacterium]MDD4076389.1 polyamine aminopropyltransferase [Bacilli bacterium]MDD4388508.1 polyamine aminopropyltransferase [Bacilli bacterium]